MIKSKKQIKYLSNIYDIILIIRKSIEFLYY